jgi:hypothetical protein
MSSDYEDLDYEVSEETVLREIVRPTGHHTVVNLVTLPPGKYVMHVPLLAEEQAVSVEVEGDRLMVRPAAEPDVGPQPGQEQSSP